MEYNISSPNELDTKRRIVYSKRWRMKRVVKSRFLLSSYQRMDIWDGWTGDVDMDGTMDVLLRTHIMIRFDTLVDSLIFDIRNNQRYIGFV